MWSTPTSATSSSTNMSSHPRYCVWVVSDHLSPLFSYGRCCPLSLPLPLSLQVRLDLSLSYMGLQPPKLWPEGKMGYRWARLELGQGWGQCLFLLLAYKEDEEAAEQLSTSQEEESETGTQQEQRPSEHVEGLRCPGSLSHGQMKGLGLLETWCFSPPAILFCSAGDLN